MYCYIFDYSNESIFKIHVHEEIMNKLRSELNDEVTDEDVLIEYGFKPSQCSWMISDDGDINIIDIYKPLK